MLLGGEWGVGVVRFYVGVVELNILGLGLLLYWFERFIIMLICCWRMLIFEVRFWLVVVVVWIFKGVRKLVVNDEVGFVE